jgi:hypothetical protein
MNVETSSNGAGHVGSACAESATQCGKAVAEPWP